MLNSEQHGLNTTSIDLVEKFKDQFIDDLTKALASSKSLETKKLLKSKKGNLSEKDLEESGFSILQNEFLSSRLFKPSK